MTQINTVPSAATVPDSRVVVIDSSEEAFEAPLPGEIDSDVKSAVSPVELRLRLVNLAAVVVPIIGLIVAIILAWGTAFDWVQFWIFVGMTYATSVGITVGYHRLFTHQSFKTKGWIRYTLAALGSMAVQGAVIEWCGAHRMHHQHSDDEDDPHSPHVHGGTTWGSGIRSTLVGFYHAHVGWLFAGRLKGNGAIHAGPAG